MASFQAKIGWKTLRKRENKNYISFTFLPDGLEKIPKKLKKIKKIYHYSLFSSQNRLKKAEKERKGKLSFRLAPTRRVIENYKKIVKKLKKLKKIAFWLLFKPKLDGKAEKERK